MKGRICIVGAAMVLGLTVAACGSNTTSSAPLVTSPPTAVTTEADVACTGGQGPNGPMPQFYQEQYSSGLAKSLKEKLADYDAAVGLDDPRQIGDTAGNLYSEIKTDGLMFKTQRLFGCYDQDVLTDVESATETFATTLDDMAMASVSIDGKAPANIAGLVSKAKPQKQTYVEALNAYASQFGGEEIPG